MCSGPVMGWVDSGVSVLCMSRRLQMENRHDCGENHKAEVSLTRAWCRNAVAPVERRAVTTVAQPPGAQTVATSNVRPFSPLARSRALLMKWRLRPHGYIPTIVGREVGNLQGLRITT
jgi:hypothetical protein